MGLAVAISLGGAMSSLLFGVKPHDPQFCAEFGHAGADRAAGQHRTGTERYAHGSVCRVTL